MMLVICRMSGWPRSAQTSCWTSIILVHRSFYRLMAVRCHDCCIMIAPKSQHYGHQHLSGCRHSQAIAQYTMVRQRDVSLIMWVFMDPWAWGMCALLTRNLRRLTTQGKRFQSSADWAYSTTQSVCEQRRRLITHLRPCYMHTFLCFAQITLSLYVNGVQSLRSLCCCNPDWQEDSWACFAVSSRIWKKRRTQGLLQPSVGYKFQTQLKSGLKYTNLDLLTWAQQCQALLFVKTCLECLTHSITYV